MLGHTLANMQSANNSGANSAVSIQEYSIRVPKNGRKKFNVMRFNATLNVDFTKWTQVKMERENNMKEYKGTEEEQPKFGAGSEFGRESREEARRKKLGFISKSYKPEDQPWILKSGGKTGKKFKGIREGGISENAAYYVFTHAADGIIEAFPLQEWYNFQPIQRYKALSAEEAEQEFGKRNRVLNYFSLMLRKRLKGDEELDGDDGGDDIKGRKGAAKKSKDLKISEMDEWMDSSSGNDSSDNEKTEKKDNDDEVDDKKKKAKKVETKNKKKNRDTEAEAFEDSDDGDDEGRELDYISSSSESEPEIEKQLQGVAEEKALRKLLTSDEDSEEDENKSNNEESNDEDKAENKNSKEDKEGNDKKKKKKKEKKDTSKKKKEEKKEKDTSSDSTADSSDSDNELKKKNKKDDKESSNASKDSTKEPGSAASSRSASPTLGLGNKRKLHSLDNISAKKSKLDISGSSSSLYIVGSSESGITEDAVRRYLMRKPMTTTELLQKFKTKKTGLSSEQLVNIMTQILKKINPVKQTIKGKMYLSIKA